MTELTKRQQSWAYGLGKSEGYVAMRPIVLATFTDMLGLGNLSGVEYVEGSKWLLITFFTGGIGSVVLKRRNGK